MENITENSCTSVFQHNPSELSEVFTQLWTQLINDREEKKNMFYEPMPPVYNRS